MEFKKKIGFYLSHSTPKVLYACYSIFANIISGYVLFFLEFAYSSVLEGRVLVAYFNETSI